MGHKVRIDAILIEQKTPLLIAQHHHSIHTPQKEQQSSFKPISFNIEMEGNNGAMSTIPRIWNKRENRNIPIEKMSDIVIKSEKPGFEIQKKQRHTYKPRLHRYITHKAIAQQEFVMIITYALRYFIIATLCRVSLVSKS